MTNTLLADRRDQIIERLSSDYATGAFEVEELEHRLALALAAQSPAELDALVTDLVPAAATLALVPARKLRIVMGSVERVGPWVVPPQLAARVVCGSLLLDLREARLAPGVTTLELDVTMGSVEVVVPPGVTVDVGASSFLGSIEQRTEQAATTSGGPVVRIVGRIKLGSLEIDTLRMRETRRDARRRRRADRRAHRRWRRFASY